MLLQLGRLPRRGGVAPSWTVRRARRARPGAVGGTLVSAGYLVHRLLRGLSPGAETLGGPLLRMLGVAVLMAVPAHVVAAVRRPRTGGSLGGILGVVAAAVLGAGIYVGAQAWLRAPELGLGHRLAAAEARRSGGRPRGPGAFG